MKFTIVERKMKISDELREYALRKVEKLERYFHTDSTATITLSELRGRQTVEITVNHVGIVFRAEETTTDMFASVDGAITSLESQIRKNKTRLERRLREGAFAKLVAAEAESVEDEYEIVRRKRFEVMPMSVDEAILQMNLVGHQFFFFKNADGNNLHSVIYKRTTGGYGIIESE